MKFEHDGLQLWYGTPNAPAPGEPVTPTRVTLRHAGQGGEAQSNDGVISTRTRQRRRLGRVALPLPDGRLGPELRPGGRPALRGSSPGRHPGGYRLHRPPSPVADITGGAMSDKAPRSSCACSTTSSWCCPCPGLRRVAIAGRATGQARVYTGENPKGGVMTSTCNCAVLAHDEPPGLVREAGR